MSCSSETCFLPLKNLMSEDSISFVNSPKVVIVARTVSVACISSFLNSRVGVADTIDNSINDMISMPLFIIWKGFGY